MAIGLAFEEVLEAARAKAEWAWARLLSDLAPPVLAYIRAHGAADPEDLFSEVLVQLVRGLGSFSGDEGGFRSWVFMIAHHRMVDERRRRARRPVPMPIEVFDRPDGDVDIETVACRSAYRSLLDRLPTDQRDVLLLRVVAGLSADETARALGKRTGTVRVLQHRALAQLRQSISNPVVTP